MQNIWVFQQQGGGEEKIRGVEVYGRDLRISRVICIDEPLPHILEEPEVYLPKVIRADLVLDFLKHPDLSDGLARICTRQGVPVVASGKKLSVPGIYSPPT
jgi:hypothetical protein